MKKLLSKLNGLKLVVITRPDFFEGETALVNRLFEEGMERLHLRKPKATEQEMAEWLEQIPQSFRHRIVLHDHHCLAQIYNLGGIHLNGRNPFYVPFDLPSDHVPCTLFDSKNIGESSAIIDHQSFTISRSCHSIEELRKYQAECDYLFLSPIFDSISKEGYGAAFSREELAQAREEGLLSDKVYALGGVCPENLNLVKQMGFAGAAMLGAVWQQY